MCVYIYTHTHTQHVPCEETWRNEEIHFLHMRMFPGALGLYSADPWTMNINRRITSITITTRRRDVVYKRTPSDLTNHSCVVPATYRAPLVQCCKPLPVKKPTTKMASKVTWRSLITPFWLRANVFCRRLNKPDAVNLTIVLSRWSRVVTCLNFVLRLLLLQTSFPVPAVLLYRPSHLVRSICRSPPLAHFLQPAVVARPFFVRLQNFFSQKLVI